MKNIYNAKNIAVHDQSQYLFRFYTSHKFSFFYYYIRTVNECSPSRVSYNVIKNMGVYPYFPNLIMSIYDIYIYKYYIYQLIPQLFAVA